MERHARWTAWAAVGAGLVLWAACRPSDAADDMGGVDERVAETAESALNGVDTTAEAVWEHLQDVAYATNWATWPGTEPLYEGREPHGALLTTYVNAAAEEAVPAMRAGTLEAMPLGAVIVKENYRPDSTLTAVTVMFKARRYDQEHDDWFWMKRLADGTTETSGRVRSCIDCHEDGTDYLMAEDLEESASRSDM